MLPSSPPPCPKCGKKKPKYIREHDEYAATSKRLTDLPESRVFTFTCECGYSFSRTVSYGKKSAAKR
jgi:hypothetical protein